MVISEMYRHFGMLIVVFVLFTLPLAKLDIIQKCRTPKNTEGKCILITECDSLYNILKKRPYTSFDADYLRQSELECGLNETVPKVCCSLHDMAVPLKSEINYNIPKPADSILLPSNEKCGIIDPNMRIIGGNNTAINEYPWMALIEYQKDNGKRGYFYCGGVLISNRYVLTAAHCLKGKVLPKKWKVVGVRLGEYDKSTEIDCLNGKCALAPVNVDVEERIAHEQYDPYDQNQYHDIALLRLTTPVNYSEFVQPICLPKMASIQAIDFTGSKLIVAGWGQTESKTESDVKLQLRVPVKSNSDCLRTYRQAGVQIGETQICAGGEKDKDSCQGDSGGPLMTLQTSEDGQFNWFVVGVVSFGPNPCGLENWPGVYTKVANYVPWIVSKLKP